jgi:hypothetical protein
VHEPADPEGVPGAPGERDAAAPHTRLAERETERSTEIQWRTASGIPRLQVRLGRSGDGSPWWIVTEWSRVGQGAANLNRRRDTCDVNLRRLASRASQTPPTFHFLQIPAISSSHNPSAHSILECVQYNLNSESLLLFHCLISASSHRGLIILLV